MALNSSNFEQQQFGTAGVKGVKVPYHFDIETDSGEAQSFSDDCDPHDRSTN